MSGLARGGGPKPKPTHLKLIEGNPGKRPLNKHEPKPTRGDLPDPPAYLNADGKREWVRVASELFNLSILTEIDRSTLAAYCQCFGRWMQAERALAKMGERDLLTEGLMIKTTNGNAIQNPIVGVANKAAADMMRYAAEFGLTPSARARLDVGPAPQASKFEGLFAGEG